MKKIIITIDDHGEIIDISTKEIKVNSTETQDQVVAVFDDRSPGWTMNPEYNLIFLYQQQTYANDKLRVKGYVFLNEVYDMLGLPRTKLGQIYGWVYSADKPGISFGIDKLGIYESRAIKLNFNVHGNILDMI